MTDGQTGQGETTREYHDALARRLRVKLPRSDAALTTAHQAAFLRRLGLSWTQLRAITGEQRGDFIALNPRALFTLRDWAGQVLEALDYQGWASQPKERIARWPTY